MGPAQQRDSGGGGSTVVAQYNSPSLPLKNFEFCAARTVRFKIRPHVMTSMTGDYPAIPALGFHLQKKSSENEVCFPKSKT